MASASFVNPRTPPPNTHPKQALRATGLFPGGLPPVRVVPCGTPHQPTFTASMPLPGSLAGEERWVPPVAREAEPERLRADLLDFARSQLSSQVKSKAAGGAGTKPGTTAASKSLSGRAVARIFHKLASPAFSSKEWKNNRYWGKHPNVDFEVLRQMAGETLETVRRANLASTKAPRAVK